MDEAYRGKVRARAYAIWEREGRPDGRADAYWNMAEDELQREERRDHPAYDRSTRPATNRSRPAIRQPGPAGPASARRRAHLPTSSDSAVHAHDGLCDQNRRGHADDHLLACGASWVGASSPYSPRCLRWRSSPPRRPPGSPSRPCGAYPLGPGVAAALAQRGVRRVGGSRPLACGSFRGVRRGRYRPIDQGAAAQEPWHEGPCSRGGSVYSFRSDWERAPRLTLPGMTLLAVGDVHGCSAHLIAMLNSPRIGDRASLRAGPALRAHHDRRLY